MGKKHRRPREPVILRPPNYQHNDLAEKKQDSALPHKKSYPKGTMPQNKNLTQINPADGGIGGLYGVFDE
ncbi:MAG: hypothetical protein LBI67_12620, partial [Treponema sp.]|nr:hypothetical protein [Treponema sp.]